MTEEEKTLIAYRMKRARDAIEEAKMLFDAGHFNAYVNRLYYACFYAVSALLLTRDLSTSKHGYLRSLMHQEFVKTGLIPKELGKHFDLLFDSRLEGDYGVSSGLETIFWVRAGPSAGRRRGYWLAGTNTKIRRPRRGPYPKTDMKRYDAAELGRNILKR